MGKLQYAKETKSSTERGKFIGTYTLAGEAIKANGGKAPMSGRIDGEVLNDVLKQTEAAWNAEIEKARTSK